ncbi:hypothetical protein [Cronobacter malonaticus]|uniref:hypothetical protein n=1 Tax=Cronobacter malonaticus TaxID=413503 RepID=UPI002A0F5839|nr:hypothetical protein [Cronobacter malonaticus]ELY5855479.1 hypothetical protein [Cronobacter malonaticus]WRU13699.1 hypothetical protein U9L39_15905 [Cronobacter malonaticus]
MMPDVWFECGECGECGKQSHFIFNGNVSCPFCKSGKAARAIIMGDKPDWFEDESISSAPQLEAQWHKE